VSATVREQLRLYASLGQVKWDRLDDEVGRFLTLFVLEEYKDMKCGSLSFGNQRKLMVAMAFIGRSDLVMLDDPLAGIDPLASKQIQKAIKQVSTESAVIISTQNPEVARTLSDKTIILHKGHIVRMGTLDNIIKTSGGAGIYISCFYDLQEIHKIDTDYFLGSNTIVQTHEEVLELFENLNEQLINNDIDALLDFELEYEHDGALAEIYNLIAKGGCQSRNYIVDLCLSLNLTEIVMEEMENEFETIKKIRQYTTHFEMKIPHTVNASYGKLYSLFEDLKEKYAI
jgi:ABC-type multidrug transport system ATPase subunit